jgi:hypothetical protein
MPSKGTFEESDSLVSKTITVFDFDIYSSHSKCVYSV